MFRVFRVCFRGMYDSQMTHPAKSLAMGKRSTPQAIQSPAAQRGLRMPGAFPVDACSSGRLAQWPGAGRVQCLGRGAAADDPAIGLLRALGLVSECGQLPGPGKSDRSTTPKREGLVLLAGLRVIARPI